MKEKPSISTRRMLGLSFIVLLLAALWFTWSRGYVSFENLVDHRDALRTFVESNYIPSVFIFILAVMATAFFIPGAIVITLAGGFLFGVLQGVLYCSTGNVIGATTAFLMARHSFGKGLMEKHGDRLSGLNMELKRYGHNYLIALRVVPVMPFFMVNYLAGLTSIRTRTFIWTTFAGMLPGSFVYCFAGSELGSIDSPGDIMSPELLVAFILLAVFALLPPLISRVKKGFGEA